MSSICPILSYRVSVGQILIIMDIHVDKKKKQRHSNTVENYNIYTKTRKTNKWKKYGQWKLDTTVQYDLQRRQCQSYDTYLHICVKVASTVNQYKVNSQWNKTSTGIQQKWVSTCRTKHIQSNYTVQQILDDWMLRLTEYTIFMFFGPQNMKMTLKFIG